MEGSSILTFQNRATGIPTDPDVADTGHFTDEVFDKLKKMGFFLNGSSDFGFTYRGQTYDEDVIFDASVSNWDVVYKSRDSDGAYYPASQRGLGWSRP